MKVFKRVLACFILCVCAFILNVIFLIISPIALQTGVIYPILITFSISGAASAVLGFYIPQLISYSKKGLRYLIMSVINIFYGFVLSIVILVYSVVNTTVPFYYYILLLIFSFLNPYFISGVIMLILYRKNYKKFK